MLSIGTWSRFIVSVVFLQSRAGIFNSFPSLLVRPSVKKTLFLYDGLAVEVVGKENFLQVLQEIDAMGLKDVERLKAGRLRRRFRSSMTEGIDNLQLIKGTSAN